MPSVKLELGRYVTLRPRANGTHRVFFQVPERLRPEGWLSLIPLPIHGARNGDLGDAEEVGRIRRDAADLYNRLVAARAGREVAPGRSLELLIRKWEAASSHKPRTAKHYGTYINHIKAWSKACGHPDPTHFTQDHVQEFLNEFDAQPVTKKHVRKTLRLVMNQAIALGWRLDNPCDRIRLTTPKSKVTIWEQSDVDAYVAAAGDMKSIALIVLLEWEIGQRLTDVRQFRPGMEYHEGAFRFWQEKTESWVTIPVSDATRAMVDKAAEGQLFLFRNERTGKAYTEERLSKTFAWVRAAAVKAGARKLQLRWLRHSCIVQLARAGCTVPEIASITGHALSGVERILSVYLPRDNAVAWAAQAKRGIIRGTGV